MLSNRMKDDLRRQRRYQLLREGVALEKIEEEKLDEKDQLEEAEELEEEKEE